MLKTQTHVYVIYVYSAIIYIQIIINKNNYNNMEINPQNHQLKIPNIKKSKHV